MDLEDYAVIGTFIYEGPDGQTDSCDEDIGSVELAENAIAKNMPTIIEINGFTYNLEGTKVNGR